MVTAGLPFGSRTISVSGFVSTFDSLAYLFFFSFFFGLMGRRLLGNFAYRAPPAIIWASTPKSSFFQTLNDGQSISHRAPSMWTNHETSFHKHSLFSTAFLVTTKQNSPPPCFLFFFFFVLNTLLLVPRIFSPAFIYINSLLTTVIFIQRFDGFQILFPSSFFSFFLSKGRFKGEINFHCRESSFSFSSCRRSIQQRTVRFAEDYIVKETEALELDSVKYKFRDSRLFEKRKELEIPENLRIFHLLQLPPAS